MQLCHIRGSSVRSLPVSLGRGNSILARGGAVYNYREYCNLEVGACDIAMRKSRSVTINTHTLNPIVWKYPEKSHNYIINGFSVRFL